jgi:hypothetical protein
MDRPGFFVTYRLLPLMMVTIPPAILLADARDVLIPSIQSNYWPSVNGKITRAEHHRFKKDNGRLIEYDRPSYTYQVGGRTYSSDLINFGERIESGETKAGDGMCGYRVGSTTTVFCNPNDPSVAVLQPGMWPHVKIAVILFSGATLLGIAGCLYQLHEWWSNLGVVPESVLQKVS